MKSKELALLTAYIADDKRGRDIRVLNVREQTDITDYFILITATNKRQMKTIVSTIKQELKKDFIQLTFCMISSAISKLA